MKIGIDLGGTNMRIGQVEGSALIKKESILCPAKASHEEILSQLNELIERNMTSKVTGIGIGVPSVVDAKHGIVYNVANIPSWKEVPLKQLLEKRFLVPVYINNDSNCFTLGEKRFGEGMPYNDLVGITIGTGIGAGVVINNKLYGGRNTGAGEIGSLPYLDYNFEHYCSSNFFTYYYNITGKEAAERAMLDDGEALKIWDTFGFHFGNFINAVLFSYDPEAIILGGGIASAFKFYEKAMWKVVASFPYPETIKNIKVIISNNNDIALLGASALIEEL